MGSLAEFAVLSPDAVAVLPDQMTMADAAGLSACGQAALKMCTIGGIKPGRGQRVLVNGGSGGVGTLLCQIARAQGAEEVVATCSAGNVDMVRELGVDEVSVQSAGIPYRIWVWGGVGCTDADEPVIAFFAGHRLSRHGSSAGPSGPNLPEPAIRRDPRRPGDTGALRAVSQLSKARRTLRQRGRHGRFHVDSLVLGQKRALAHNTRRHAQAICHVQHNSRWKGGGEACRDSPSWQIKGRGGFGVRHGPGAGGALMIMINPPSYHVGGMLSTGKNI